MLATSCSRLAASSVALACMLRSCAAASSAFLKSSDRRASSASRSSSALRSAVLEAAMSRSALRCRLESLSFARAICRSVCCRGRASGSGSGQARDAKGTAQNRRGYVRTCFRVSSSATSA